jgi:hypothetical protein
VRQAQLAARERTISSTIAMMGMWCVASRAARVAAGPALAQVPARLALTGQLLKPITRQTIRMFKTVRLRLIASGVADLEATQRAADEVVAKRRAIARERRKARREAKYGPDASRFRHALPSAMRNGATTVRVELRNLRIERYRKTKATHARKSWK